MKKSGLLHRIGHSFLNSGEIWKQIVNKLRSLSSQMLWKFSKQQVKIFEGIYPVCFGSFNQDVQLSGGISVLPMRNKHPLFQKE